jgi:O-antigen/teichoic acid export membrane protein
VTKANMTKDEITGRIWYNSISNYICIVLRMVLGFMLFRLLITNLSGEEFGFWAILWSVFGFGILLDFGFGFTAVKRVAELSVHQEWEKLSRVLSTIFYFYVLIGILIAAVILVGSHALVGVFRITAENQELFREILIYFFLGMAIAFPLGIFPEILNGQQRIFLANTIFASSTVLNFILILLALNAGWGLKPIVMIGLFSSIAPNLVCALFALSKLPQVKIRPRFFSVGMIRETMRFSLFAYVSTVSNMLMMKTDQMIIGTGLAVAAVAIYQAGAKVGEMFGAMTQQLPDTFSPVAAHLHARGDRQFLRQLLVNGTRFSVMIATPFYLIFAFYMDALLGLLTGEKVPNPETWWTGQVLLLWGYVSLMTQSVSKRIFMMCGHERKLMWLGLAEAAMNLGLSVGLLLHMKNVLGVALGSLISTSVFGFVYLWPWAAREANLTGWGLARQVVFPIWLGCAPLLAFLFAGSFIPGLDVRGNPFSFLAASALGMMLAGAGLWRAAMTAEDRQAVMLKVGKYFQKPSVS